MERARDRTGALIGRKYRGALVIVSLRPLVRRLGQLDVEIGDLRRAKTIEPGVLLRGERDAIAAELRASSHPGTFRAHEEPCLFAKPRRKHGSRILALEGPRDKEAR